MSEAAHSSQNTTTTANPPTGQVHVKPTASSPNIIVLKCGEKSVVVRVVSYKDAQALAQREFEELRHVPRERIEFSYLEKGWILRHAERTELRVSEGAWLSVMGSLQPNSGLTVFVSIRPDPDAKLDPPQYLEVPGISSIAQAPILQHSGSNLSSSSQSSNKSSKSGRGISVSWRGSGK